MAASPQFKVYQVDGEYIAACKYAEDAAAILAKRDTKGDSIRLGHDKRVMFVNKVDGDCSESFDAPIECFRNKYGII